MKILVICQYYYPEPFRITDICEELVKRGHKVTVITGIPNYPMGEIYAGYRFGKKRDEIINGVNVHRCFTVGRRQGAIYRFLNYYSFAISSTHYVKGIENEYDLVFVNQLSPIMMADAGLAHKKKHHKRLVLYCLDIWPESLTTGGVKKGSRIYKYFHALSEEIYKQADVILISSQSFSKYFQEEFNITNTHYLPQYAEDTFTPDKCRKEPNGYIDLMFAGNVGKAQSVDTIIKAAQRSTDINNLRWHIVGDGSELARLKKMAEGIDSIIFHGRIPLEEMSKYYSMADAMLVTMQKDPILNLTLPGKVQTYLAAGKPIIAACDGETRNVIKEAECGYCTEADNEMDFSAIIREFASNAVDCKILSRNAILYYEQKFSKLSFFQLLEYYFKEYDY